MRLLHNTLMNVLMYMYGNEYHDFLKNQYRV